MANISVTVNGTRYEGEAESRRTLVDFLRQDLGLTGTHVGCEYGACGACTVIVDGDPVRACLMLAAQADGATIETIEGLGDGETLHPVQQAMREHHSFQCGFCTPGFVMTAVAMLRENPDPSEAEVRHGLSGNLCRCTGYQSIVAGVLGAAKGGSGTRAAQE
jgi:carbon-monoxide dehydrogenase small subunit